MPALLQLATVYQGLFRKSRYKVRWGGRGAGKSWAFAQALVALAYTQRLRILCVRELQNSIKDSVHKLLKDQIIALKLEPWFHVTERSIICRTTGSEFLFKGLRTNAAEIKSTEGVDICWVEEAQLVSKASWELLIPTIRKEGSEIWVSLNPVEESDATYQRFIKNSPPSSDVMKVNWDSNPWFPQELDRERLYLRSIDPIAYGHVWEGECLTITDAVIFKGRFIVEDFETPTEGGGPRFFHGADFGFGPDPAVLIRCYVTNIDGAEELWIDQESFGHGVEQDDLPALYDKIPTARKWPIKADSSRPETISHIRRRGFTISAADKWPGSVEDGIAHLKMFRVIHVHTRCKNTAFEFRSYKYKVDRVSGEVLPIIVDQHQHAIDSIRYSLCGYIQRRGQNEIWSKL